MQLISLADVLLTMDTTADPFDVVFCTADRTRGTGGELVRLVGCLATSTSKAQAADQAPAPVPAPAAEPPKWTDVVRSKPAKKRPQTRNVTILSSGKVRALHPRLIVEFNGQKVRW